MYCKNCGNKLNQDNLYCSKCGAKNENNYINNSSVINENEIKNINILETPKIKFKILKLTFFRSLIGIICILPVFLILYILSNTNTNTILLVVPIITYIILLLILNKKIKTEKLIECFISFVIFPWIYMFMSVIGASIVVMISREDGVGILVFSIFYTFIYYIINTVIDLFTYFSNKIISFKKFKTNCK